MIDSHLVEGGCDDNLVCAICTLVLKVPTSGCPQGHTFCETCLVHALKATPRGRDATCPTCRHPTGLDRLVRNRPIENMVRALRVACPHSV